MQTIRIIGWSVFLAGISIILFSLSSSYNIFTGKAEVPKLFVFEEKKDQEPAQQGTIVSGVQGQIEEIIRHQLEGVLPSFDMFSGGTFAKIFNLVTWSLGAGILIFGGAQIAGLGVKLLGIPPEKQEIEP
jgi:hypothetical protein